MQVFSDFHCCTRYCPQLHTDTHIYTQMAQIPIHAHKYRDEKLHRHIILLPSSSRYLTLSGFLSHSAN